MRGDVVVQADQAFLDQHHEGDGRDRLGHRVDAEDGVLPHRLAALEVDVSGHAGMDQRAAAVDLGQDAGEAAGIDVTAGHDLVQAGEALG